ncbi:PepSY-associated TM helix domain-containing protein [Gilvimarinus chinensis]|uniref:PepSY-associated TM helix domain-containing protein n=1 Tax=Gilvimarinus chinensis TaxID=396005 RepID=UPI0003600102|nr:PepSY-associated TM helix domain-containing protein [Gilvimarinus chinensis]
MSTSAKPKSHSTKPRTSVRGWFDWHSWSGILLGVLLFIVCWGGTFATIANELDWLTTPALRVQPVGDPVPIEEAYQRVQQAFPDATIGAISAPLYKRSAYDVSIKTAAGEPRHVYVDPYTNRITGSVSYLNIQRYLRDFHRRFFAGNIGFYLVCLTAIPLFISLVTALVFYRRWWQRFFTFNKARSVRAFVSNLHQLLGLWAMWFVLVIAITGTWYLAERVRSQFIDGKFSYVDALPSAIKPLPVLETGQPQQRSFSELINIVKTSRPDLTVGTVYPDRNGYFYVVGQSEHWLVRDRANKVFVHPDTGEIKYNQRADDLNAYWRWSNMADPLHFGNFAGLISKVVWFSFGLILCFLCLSGVWLFARRLQRNKKYRRKMRFAYGAITASGVLVAVCAPLPLFFLDKFGPKVNGVAYPAELGAGTLGFLIAWIILTVLLSVSWLWVLRGSYVAIGKSR